MESSGIDEQLHGLFVLNGQHGVTFLNETTAASLDCELM
jgi:hypothetical protein